MFNKKAIAALAAGATLLSGLAFAAPAMADAKLPADAIANAKKQEQADKDELAKKVEENKAKENKAVLDNLDKSKAFDNFLNGSEKGDIVNGSLSTLNGRGAAEVSAARSKANEATAALNALKAKWADMLAQADYLDAEGEHEAAAALRKSYYLSLIHI